MRAFATKCTAIEQQAVDVFEQLDSRFCNPLVMKALGWFAR